MLSHKWFFYLYQNTEWQEIEQKDGVWWFIGLETDMQNKTVSSV